MAFLGADDDYSSPLVTPVVRSMGTADSAFIGRQDNADATLDTMLNAISGGQRAEDIVDKLCEFIRSLLAGRRCRMCRGLYTEQHNYNYQCWIHPGEYNQEFARSDIRAPLDHWECCLASNNHRDAHYDMNSIQGCVAIDHNIDISRPHSMFMVVPLSLRKSIVPAIAKDKIIATINNVTDELTYMHHKNLRVYGQRTVSFALYDLPLARAFSGSLMRFYEHHGPSMKVESNTSESATVLSSAQRHTLYDDSSAFEPYMVVRRVAEERDERRMENFAAPSCDPTKREPKPLYDISDLNHRSKWQERVQRSWAASYTLEGSVHPSSKQEGVRW